MLEQDQKIHVSSIRSDPCTMWRALEAVHIQKKPGVQFNAYDNLFSIRKHEEESLQLLMSRVDNTMQKISNVRPSSFNLNDFDSKLASMVLIRALPKEYSGFTSSLLLLDKLDKNTIHQAFVTEETQCRCRAEAPSIALAASAIASSSKKKKWSL